jgi:hypothetical protein
MAVPDQPPQVGSPDRVRLADEAEFPAGYLTRSCGDRALVSEIVADPASGPTVGYKTPAIEHATEQIRCMPHLPFPG